METHVQFTGSVCSPQQFAEIMAPPDIGKRYMFVTFSAIGTSRDLIVISKGGTDISLNTQQMMFTSLRVFVL